MQQIISSIGQDAFYITAREFHYFCQSAQCGLCQVTCSGDFQIPCRVALKFRMKQWHHVVNYICEMSCSSVDSLKVQKTKWEFGMKCAFVLIWHLHIVYDYVIVRVTSTNQNESFILLLDSFI